MVAPFRSELPRQNGTRQLLRENGCRTWPRHPHTHSIWLLPSALAIRNSQSLVCVNHEDSCSWVFSSTPAGALAALGGRSIETISIRHACARHFPDIPSLAMPDALMFLPSTTRTVESARGCKPKPAEFVQLAKINDYSKSIPSKIVSKSIGFRLSRNA